MEVLAHLDIPADGVVRTAGSMVQGWIAADETLPFEQLSLVNAAGAVIPLRSVERPDVRIARPGKATIGFSGWVGINDALTGPWRLRYENAGGAHDAPVQLSADLPEVSRLREAKGRKLAALAPILRCPVCRGTLRAGEARTFCENAHEFAVNAEHYDFLNDDVRKRVGAIETENVSAHGYDPVALQLIAASDGPILNVGAGWRPDYRDVVNVEIVPYPSTDVVAASEFLPFADDSFALVISVAVLEHVRDPFAAARELVRVMKPGGRIFAAVPFLQPYHGYPNHYFNMTASGLRSLFADLEVERLEVPASGHPIFALTWMLRSWLKALPPEAARSFERLRVAELVGEPEPLFARDFVAELPVAAQNELAALNLLVARKR